VDYAPALKMVAIYSSETLEYSQSTKHYNNLEDYITVNYSYSICLNMMWLKYPVFFSNL
jgi:hypothetical protein